MSEDVGDWLIENADRVGNDLLRGIGTEDGIGFIIILTHKGSKKMELRTNIVKGPLMYLLQRAKDFIGKRPESRIITLNIPDDKIIKA